MTNVLIPKKNLAFPMPKLLVYSFFRGERYLTVKTLANRMEAAKSRITKIIKGLMAKGLVEKN